MSKCLTCGDPIEQKKGKRKRLYCSDICRLRAWQAKNKVKSSTEKENTKPKEEPKQPENLTFSNSIDKMLWEAEQEILSRKK